MSAVDLRALVAAYDEHSPYLVRVAHAVLGDRDVAVQVVADCRLTLIAIAATTEDTVEVVDVLGWATEAVSRDALVARRKMRPGRPARVDPVIIERPLAVVSPGHDDLTSVDAAVRSALIAALEHLTPAERTAWLLRDLFKVPDADVAREVGRTPEAVQQLAGRARELVRGWTPRDEVTRVTQERVVTAFLAAAACGDLAGSSALLDPGVVLMRSGPGEQEAHQLVGGPDCVSTVVVDIVRTESGAGHARVTTGSAADASADGGGVVPLTAAFRVVDGLITHIDVTCPSGSSTDA